MNIVDYDVCLCRLMSQFVADVNIQSTVGMLLCTDSLHTQLVLHYWYADLHL